MVKRRVGAKGLTRLQIKEKVGWARLYKKILGAGGGRKGEKRDGSLQGRGAKRGQNSLIIIHKWYMQHRLCQENTSPRVLFMFTEQSKFVLVSHSKCKLILSYSFLLLWPALSTYIYVLPTPCCDLKEWWILMSALLSYFLIISQLAHVFILFRRKIIFLLWLGIGQAELN